MPLKMRFPASAVAQLTKVESTFLYCVERIRDHFSGRALPKGMAIDAGHSAVWDQSFMTRLRLPLQGNIATLESSIQLAWMATTAMHNELRGKTVDDMYEILSRQHTTVVKFLVESFFEGDEDYLAFNLKSTTQPRYGHSQESTRPWAWWSSNCVGDIPADIKVGSNGISMIWHDVNGKMHRDVTRGPALVEVSLPDGTVSVDHFNRGARTIGHDNWAERCAKSNLWLKFTSEEE